MLSSIYQIMISVLMGAVGQVCMKYGVGRAPGAESDAAAAKLAGILTVPYVWLGLFLYAGSAMIWLLVLSRERLSFAYPLISISYIAVLLLSRLLFKEPISMVNWAGVLVICLGVVLVTRA